MINEIAYIKEHLPTEENLLQLSEEACELAQAASGLAQSALKLRRAMDGTNPTPVTIEEATASLLEEYGDVVNCIEVLLTEKQRDLAMEMRKTKLIRWADRLKQGKKETEQE